MGKVNLFIKTCLRNEKNEYNIKGIYQDNKIKFKLLDSLMILDKKNNILEKSLQNDKIFLDFFNNNCLVESDNLKLNFDIKVIDLINLDKYFNVKYKIEHDVYEFEIDIK